MQRIRCEVTPKPLFHGDSLDRFRQFILANCAATFANYITGAGIRDVLKEANEQLRRSNIFVAEFGSVEVIFVRPGAHIETVEAMLREATPSPT